MAEAGAKGNSAKSSAFALHAGTSFMLSWHLENQTKATRGVLSVSGKANEFYSTSPGLTVATSSHGLAAADYRGPPPLQPQLT